MDRPALVVSPYDTELFGHWWYEGPEFLNLYVRKAYYDQKTFTFITPEAYLKLHPTNQVARPSPSSWGEEGYYKLWLNELKNAGVTILGYNLAGLPTQLEPAKYERMIFGLILVLMMIFRPQGIFPARRRQRELGQR